MGEGKDTNRLESELVEDLEVDDATAEEVAGGAGKKAPSPPQEYFKVTMTDVLIT